MKPAGVLCAAAVGGLEVPLLVCCSIGDRRCGGYEEKAQLTIRMLTAAATPVAIRMPARAR